MPQVNAFEIGELKFAQRPLKLKAALKAETILAEAVLPAISGFAGLASGGAGNPVDLRAALAGLERVGQLTDLFVAACKVDWAGRAEVELGPFVDVVFERRPAVFLSWLLACIEWEFADFFEESGRALLASQASRLVSRLGSIGESGG